MTEAMEVEEAGTEEKEAAVVTGVDTGAGEEVGEVEAHLSRKHLQVLRCSFIPTISRSRLKSQLRCIYMEWTLGQRLITMILMLKGKL